MEIKKTHNGYIVETYDGEDFNDFVYEIDDNLEETKGEQLALRNVFYQMMEYFAVNNDKHVNEGEGQFMEIKVSGDE